MVVASSVSLPLIHPSKATFHSLSQPRYPQSACERCHKNKEKCHFNSGQQSCTSCTRLKRHCQLRWKKRMGRKPVERRSPYGCYSITSPRPQSNSNKTGSQSDMQITASFAETLTLTAHCKSIPEYSDWTYSPNVLYNFTLQPSNIYHQRINHVLTTKEGFFNAHRRFMVGESFSDEYHATVLVLFSHSPSILADAYNALLDLMSSQQVKVKPLDSLDMTLGSRCLQYLMTLLSSIVQAEDAAVAVYLGQIMLAFNAIIPMGSSTRTITRATLLGVKSWYGTIQRRPELDTITVAPVLVDTIDCLIRREMPVIRFPVTERSILDRFSGVCSSLLPLLYDLCECSHQQKTMATAGDVEPDNTRLDPYKKIEQKIINWMPTYPPRLFKHLSAPEVSAIFAQARSYRFASLLVIHRLRYPLGIEDKLGQHYAQSIFEELAPLKSWSPDGATGLGLDYPLLVAMVEIPTLGEQLFQAFEPLRYRKRQSEDIFAFIEYVKEARRSGYKGIWFDLVEGSFRGDILP